MGDQFRFESLEVWQHAVKLTDLLLLLADRLERDRKYRFAEQLRGATLSITNNIAEGSGSISKAEFANYLNMSRRSVFEVANILLVLSHHGVLLRSEVEPLLASLEEQSRMTLAFIRSLKKQP